MKSPGPLSLLGILLFAATVATGQMPSDSDKIVIEKKSKAPRGPMHVSIKPYVAVNSGHTTYEMDESGYDGSEFIRVRSKLEFPLDVTLAGANVTVELPDRRWRLEGGFWANVQDPDKKMKDYDWLTAGPFNDAMISYTESDALMSAFEFKLGAGYRVLEREKVRWFVNAGFRYQKVDQDINGYKGWQLDTNLQRFPVAGTEPAIAYQISYKMPLFGMSIEWQPLPSLKFSLSGSGVYFWVNDVDDHLIRGKESTAKGTGTGGLGGIEGAYLFGSGSRGVTPFIGFTGELLYLSSTARQTQRWYRDELDYSTDPPTVLVPAGTVIYGIHHKITSKQTRIGVSAGVRF
ncbi:MAG: omptin family outer membrane protease [Candidatus Zixiibacteriota bacterium]